MLLTNFADLRRSPFLTMRTLAGIRLVVTVAVMAAASEAIRVYEGTNLGPGQSQSHLRAESRSDVRSDQLLKFSKELKPTPNLYKVKLTQQGYLQFLRYLADIPPLREYTFCLWFMSNNLSHPHPLFSYSMQDKARLLSMWYEPADATVRMSVRDDLVFKVPALVREGQWHHVCQSWNGVFGEWAVFFDGAKIGSGKLQKYKGTYVPGGGEVVVGQEPTDFYKGLDDGIEGEVFGFNLVDEAVKDEVTVARHPPISDPVPQATQYIPPFKALPPMKKSYHEIKTFIKSLPPPPSAYGTRNGPKTAAPGGRPPPKPHHKGKPSKRPGRPTRGKPRPHYKPVKAIVYEREDRKLRLDESALTKKLGTPAEEEEGGSNQVYDENYSIHSYKAPKERSRTAGYEIREAAAEEEADGKPGQRKARLSFDLHAARKANGLYEKANRARRQKKQPFHFEAAKEKHAEGIRRSLNAEKSEGRPRDAIPVREVVEEDSARRKRDLSGDDLSAGFRPMPRMPDGFIDQFGRGNVTAPERPREADKRNDVFDAPGQLRRNMVVSVRELQRRPGPTSGSELVKRSYEECAADRGSPLRDKDRLVVSWAETPVRIYGGAVVTTALGLCGHF